MLSLDPIPYLPDEMLALLESHAVRYVVIGGLAAQIRGSPYITRDVDVTPLRDRENFGRLALALVAMDAKLRVPDVVEPIAIRLDERSFGLGSTWTFVTKFGNLDIALLPDGTRGYPDLMVHATRERITETLEVWVSSLADIVRSKEAAGREKDRAVLAALRIALERSEGGR